MWVRSTTTGRPSTTTSVTSAAVAANTTFSTVAPPPAVRTDSRSTATRSARAPTRSSPASDQPSARWPSTVAASSSRGAASRPRSRRTSRSSSSTARASSNRSMTAWLSEPRLNGPGPSISAGAGPTPSPRSRSVVGQKQTPVALPSQVGDVALGQVGGVHGGGARARARRGRASARSGVQPCTARHWSTSAVCSEEWMCNGASWRAAQSTTGGHLVDGHGAHGMHCRADKYARCRVALQRTRPAAPSAHRRRRRTAVAARRPAGRRRLPDVR